MPIAFTCPHCGQFTNVSAEFAGMSGPCAKCGQQITIPLMPGMTPAEGLPAAPTGAGRSMVTWIILLVAGLSLLSCFLCMGVGLTLPAIQAAREAARRAQCLNNLRQIGIALSQYNLDHGSFPPAYVADENGNRLHSWRALLLPYLDEDLAAEYDFNEPWDSHKNIALLHRMPSVYACPSDPDHEGGFTSYLACDGPNHVFQGPRGVALSEITDGTSRTIAVMESAGTQIPWLQPRDGEELEQSSATDNLYSNHPGGANVLYADGNAEFISDDIDPQVLRELELINDGGRGESVLGPPDSNADNSDHEVERGQGPPDSSPPDSTDDAQL
jgi:prepilin-type processing-associated H-X9-DG protein